MWMNGSSMFRSASLLTTAQQVYELELCREIVTCGGDGYIKIWQVNANGGLGSNLRNMPLIISEPAPDAAVPAPLARSLAIDGTGRMLVGTAACDIWEVSPEGKAKIALYGHHGDVHGLAMNHKAAYGHIFATCSDSCKVAVWSLATNKVCQCCPTPGMKIDKQQRIYFEAMGCRSSRLLPCQSVQGVLHSQSMASIWLWACKVEHCALWDSIPQWRRMPGVYHAQTASQSWHTHRMEGI
jgi:WD40 repeat protein